MKATRFAPSPAWRRGALFFALIAMMLPVFTGCSSDFDQPTEPEQGLSLSGDMPSMNLAPDFCPTLPDFPVVVIHTQTGTSPTLFDIWFWGIGDGYDVATDDTLPGWCVEDFPLPNVRDPGRVTMYCSYDDALPGNLSSMIPVPELNYLLNHRYGTWQEIQAAIWLLLGYSEPSIPATANSVAMYEDALANGGDFVPGPGDLIAIFLYTGDGGISADGTYQETIIELRLPGDDTGSGACTPGYWRTHFDRWPEPYMPSDDFDTTFGTDYFDADMTLGQAAWARGGGLYRLARHGTAALLNAAHGDVDYPYTVAEVIAMVQAGEADMLADANEEFDCPLGGTPADPQAFLAD